jgi:Tol biopolymer transport system component
MLRVREDDAVGSFRIGIALRLAAATGLAAAALAASPIGAQAQYFGRNKVQYESFDFRTMHSDHFDLLYYPPESLLVADAGRMAERWYVRHHALFNADFNKRSIVIYGDHTDFQQTNALGGFIGQETGGVTTGLNSQVILPFDGVYADNDHVLGHELVHVFQFDIASATKGGLNTMNQLPLWWTEGMAEYGSLGRNDPNTAMWLRDAAITGKLPTLKQMTQRPDLYFPYRYGEAFWAYVGGRWGDEAINTLYRVSLQTGWEGAVRRLLGMSSDTLSAQWLAATKAAYLPLMAGRDTGDQVAPRLLRPFSRKFGDMDVAPQLSPDGHYVAFYTSRGLFNIDLYVADAETGKIVKKLTGPNTDTHFEAISFISASGGWSPDGKRFAFIVYADGDNEIEIYNVESGESSHKPLHFKNVSMINDVSWSPDGEKLAFSGIWGGASDIYVYDLRTKELRQLTHDRYADLQPTWSPDGRSLVFSTDRGPNGTDFERLSYGPMQLAMMDVASGDIRMLPGFERWKEINPQYSPDGRDLYFISDRDGFNDIYRMELATGRVFQVTRTATGISGITALSPALSVARQNGRLMFSLFERGGYSLHRLEPDQARGRLVGTVMANALPLLAPATPQTPTSDPAVRVDTASPTDTVVPRDTGAHADTGVRADTGARPNAPAPADTTQHATSAAGQSDTVAMAGVLPPLDVPGGGEITQRVGDPITGLPPTETLPTSPYKSSLSLQYIGSSGVGIGVATGPFGGVVAGGGVAAYWSDLLGNKVIGAQIAGGGDIRNFGGGIAYQNLEHRWNWGVGISHTPYITGFASIQDTTLDLGGGQQLPALLYEQELLRTYFEQAMFTTQYPFSLTRRVEFTAGFTHVGYGLEIDRYLVAGNQAVGLDRTSGQTPPGINFAQVGAALVGDYSVFGFTSPIAGGRYRLEVDPTFGGLTFQNVLADYRRYLYAKPFTFAFRALHFARYGKDGEDQRLSPLYVGDPVFVRGYDVNNINVSKECGDQVNSTGQCPVFDRLVGSRIAVANFEIRVPLFGTDQLGLINFPYLPTEIAPFFDAGVAWCARNSTSQFCEQPSPSWKFSENTPDRVPVFSTGISARVNLLGYAVLEIFYVHPFQRPEKGNHFGFQLSPGW